MEETMDTKYKLDLVELGKRIAIIRDEVLLMTQKDLATYLKTTQTILSRLELGKGGTIYIVMDFLNYLHNKGFRGHMLFREPFDITLFTFNVSETEKTKILANIDEISEKMIALKGMII